MFPDNHTYHPDVSDGRRAFLMGNALVCGIVQKIGKSLYEFIYEKAPISTLPIDMQRDALPKLSLDLFAEMDSQLKCNPIKKNFRLEMTKNVLVMSSQIIQITFLIVVNLRFTIRAKQGLFLQQLL